MSFVASHYAVTHGYPPPAHAALHPEEWHGTDSGRPRTDRVTASQSCRLMAGVGQTLRSSGAQLTQCGHSRLMPSLIERAETLRPTGLLPLLTTVQLMAYYGVSNWTVAKWVRAGLPVEPMASRGWRFDLATCRAWHRQQAAAPV